MRIILYKDPPQASNVGTLIRSGDYIDICWYDGPGCGDMGTTAQCLASSGWDSDNCVSNSKHASNDYYIRIWDILDPAAPFNKN